MNKPKVGQKVYVVECGNLSPRDGSKPKSYYSEVTKVGSKYFYINTGWRDLKFFIKDWWQCSDYSRDYILYESKDSYLYEKEKERLYRLIRMELFDALSPTKRLNLNQLKTIAEFAGIERNLQ